MWSLQMDGWRDNGRSVMAKAHKSLWVGRPENRSASIKHQYLPLYDKRVLIVFFYKSTIETRIIIKHQSLAKYIYFIHLCIKSFINVIGNIKWICRHSNTIPPLLEHMVAYIYIYTFLQQQIYLQLSWKQFTDQGMTWNLPCFL